MTLPRVKRIIGLFLLLLSLILLAWGLWPLGSEVRTLPVAPENMQISEPGSFVPLDPGPVGLPGGEFAVSVTISPLSWEAPG